MGKIEIASFNVQAAIIAEGYGADRVELCAEMNVGGTTPSFEDIEEVRSKIDIDLNVMIRPRGGNFVYSEVEIEQMRQEILAIKELKVDGLVFGVLDEDHTVNKALNKMLVDLAYPLPCTFHRAFDEVPDMKGALEDVIDCGFKTILTSGCEPNVIAGLANLKQLVAWAGDRIVIMPGGGLRSKNVEEVLRETGANFFHSSAITDGGDTAVAMEVAALKANAQ